MIKVHDRGGPPQSFEGRLGGLRRSRHASRSEFAFTGNENVAFKMGTATSSPTRARPGRQSGASSSAPSAGGHPASGATAPRGSSWSSSLARSLRRECRFGSRTTEPADLLRDHSCDRAALQCSPMPTTPAVLEPDLQEAEDTNPSGPRIRCPVCGWTPAKHHLWSCSCGHHWNTFDTGGVCPACMHQWTSTQCPSCGKWSAHSEWYQ